MRQTLEPYLRTSQEELFALQLKRLTSNCVCAATVHIVFVTMAINQSNSLQLCHFVHVLIREPAAVRQ